MPARAMTHSCAIPGCPKPGRNQLGLRNRVAHSGASPFPNKRRTDALWSVESSIFLCDQHSLAGGVVRLTFEPANTREIVLEAICGGDPVEPRSKEIRQPLDEAA
jgi:hypothetical protein